MLRYELAKQIFDNDIYTLVCNNINTTDYSNDNGNYVLVELECEDVKFVDDTDIISFAVKYVFHDDEIQDCVRFGEVGKLSVYAVNYFTNSVYLIDYKYKTLKIADISAKVDSEAGTIVWAFTFEDTHYYGDEVIPELYISFNDKMVHLNNSLLSSENYYTINWVYDATVDNAQDLSNVLFGPIDMSIDGVVKGDITQIDRIYREQPRWAITDSIKFNSAFTVNKYKVSMNIPISLKSSVGLYSEGNIKEYFIEQEEQKAINPPIEMEKYVYTPVVVTKLQGDTPIFEDCAKINFNLHFRAHDGDDWTVDNSDSWNFEKCGDYNNWGTNKYYSYTPSPASPTDSNKWKRSCQSDLLGYLGFTTNDVKYQKNKLKKSFIRLFFYDSDNTASQNLLSYSTIFVDSNKLYSKFISKANFECYYDDNGDIVKGIKVDREVSVYDLTRILKYSGLTTEEIEEYRLSSQISVRNKYLSNNSSEGFYLYKWEGDNEINVPCDLYLKVEFNHAGYGRNIPMMAPYNDGQTKGFKTNEDIIRDWADTSTQYGIKKYRRYSYIHLKCKYDINTNRRIYYLDPDTYGVSKDGNIININLYEARISFND